MTADAIILGCVETKHPGPAMAKDLYASPLWQKRRRYAESSGKPWYIFSAEHGIIRPETVIEYYDVAMSGLPREQIRRKGEQAAGQLESIVGNLRGKRFEIHAGASYVRALEGALGRRGARLEQPLEGLKFGYQLHWYDQQAGVEKTPSSDAPRKVTPVPPPATSDASRVADVDIGQVSIHEVRTIEAFEFRWPENLEAFEYGWEFIAHEGARRWRMRHGIGGRVVYGRHRRHTVTWVDGQPMVEGVASDDYEYSAALISLIRLGGKAHVRSLDELPVGYAGFEIVRQSDEINAKWVPQSLSVKLFEDDLEGWARHAILRAKSKGVDAGQPKSQSRVARPTVVPDSLPPAPTPDRRAVADALLAFARSEAAKQGVQRTEFTPNPEANALLFDDPFAFLLAVIFDQGIIAERAWAAPFELRRRLGHLDPYRIASDDGAVARAIATPPQLQRFVNTVPGWVVAAARRVVREYAGNAGTIWGDRPTADALKARLDDFEGIGQKKAAMAVEMLARDLKVEITDMHQSDIAFDVHVRRVMLRTGLAEGDDVGHMVEAARAIHPERPGELDLPMWLVGRSWCRPGVPLCSDCPVFEACPRLISQANTVTGA